MRDGQNRTAVWPLSSNPVTTAEVRARHGTTLYASVAWSQSLALPSPCLPPSSAGQLKLPCGQLLVDDSLSSISKSSADFLPPPTVGVAEVRVSMRLGSLPCQ